MRREVDHQQAIQIITRSGYRAVAGPAPFSAEAGYGVGNAGRRRSGEGQSMDITDVDILQFALNLEYLEAEFYTVAVSGRTIHAFSVGIDGAGVAGATTGGNRVIFNSSMLPVMSVMEELAFDERAHVNLLRGALMAAGVEPVAKPAINLSGLGFGFGGQVDFITLARILEDIGVTAYVWAAPPSGGRYFAVDDNALAAVRTPAQVLYLAYGLKEGLAGGGFYPMGMNGTIRMSGKSA